MATQVQFRRGNTSQTNAFTGAVAEITVDTDKDTVVVHDGSTAGGFPLARESSLSANLAFTQAAFNKANTANVTAEAAYAWGNTINVFTQSAFNKANTANVTAEASYAWANTINIKVDSAYAFSNTVNIKTDAAFTRANAANILAQAAFNQANTTNVTAEAAFARANAANVLAQAAFNQANTANVTAEAGFSKANSANILAQAAFNQANTANVTAQAAFNKANNAVANTGGSISGDLTITGNLTVVGQQVYANTQTVLIKDNIITLNAAIDQSSAPSANAGLEIDRGSSANVYLLWNEASDVWQFTNDGTTYFTIADAATLTSAFNLANTSNVTAEAGFARANAANVLAQAAFNQANTRLANTGTSVVANSLTQYTFANTTSSTSTTTGAVIISGGLGVAGNIYASAIYDGGIEIIVFANQAFNKANTANVTAEAAFSKANSSNVLAQAAFDKANSVTQQGFVTVAANGVNVVADANNDTLTLSAANGVAITSNATTDTITINLTPTGVTSGTYGSAAIVPVLVVDAQGRLSSVSNTTISIPTTAVTGTFGFSSGGTNATSYTTGTLLVSNGTAIVSLANTGTAGTYGNTTHVPVITTDAYGRVSSVTNTAIVFPSDLANTGTSVTANGLTRYTFANTTSSTSTTTGAVIISGGLGVAGNVYANNIYDGGVEILTFTQASFNQANTTNVTAEAAFSRANSANILAQAAFNQANTDATSVSVVAGTYGNASAIPSITVAANGRITAINTAAFTAASIGDALALSIALG